MLLQLIRYHKKRQNTWLNVSFTTLQLFMKHLLTTLPLSEDSIFPSKLSWHQKEYQIINSKLSSEEIGLEMFWCFGVNI